MANRNSNNNRRSKYSELEKISYKMGQIKRGLKNPDSRITESFNNGLNGKPSNKKPLF